MPAYASTIIFVFILASCVYKKHIRDWWWFRLGVVSFLVSVAAGAATGLLGFLTSSQLVSVVVGYLSNLALIAAMGAFVFCAIKNVEVDAVELRCPQCNYRLKGLAEPRCPECGWKI